MSIVTLEEAVDAAVFGGKAAQLAVALRRGLPVPPGLAISTHATAAIGAGDASTLEQLHVALTRLRATTFAVRSSGVGEDAAEASYAGQHTTCLNVARPGIREATAHVWRSATAPAAAGYRQRIGLREDDVGMAVVVQELVAADVAGVLFTRDPMTGADERVIEASWGLGEVVVAGLVVPDRFRLTRGGEVLERSAGLKDVIAARDGAGGTVLRDADEETAGRLCLDDAALAQLAALALACEDVFSGPLDLEWAFASGQLWLLQARPITAGSG